MIAGKRGNTLGRLSHRMDRQAAGMGRSIWDEKRSRAALIPCLHFRLVGEIGIKGEYPLNDAYIGLRSLTYAQRAARWLSGQGIRADAVRAPWSGSGCSYAVRLRREDLVNALARLREGDFVPGRIFLRERDGTVREAAP